MGRSSGTIMPRKSGYEGSAGGIGLRCCTSYATPLLVWLGAER